jgi:ribosomal protein S18 acetylase RimI-like enzyme
MCRPARTHLKIIGVSSLCFPCQSIRLGFFLKANLILNSLTTWSGIPVKPCSYRFARRSDLQILRPGLGAGAWSRLSRLLQFSCTKPEWIILGFKAGALADTWVLAAPSEFNLPLEIIRLHAGLNGRTEALRSFQLAIEKAKILGAHELYCAISEDSDDASVVSEAGFCQWRKVVRFESAGPADLRLRGYRSTEAGNFRRSETIALIEKTSEGCFDSQIEFYRQSLGGIADAEMTLQMMESTRYDPRWWRVALASDGNPLGIIFPVLAFGELTVGFIGVVPEYRGRNIASFLLAEAWSLMKHQGHSSLCAEVDEQNISMHRVLTKSQFSRRWQKQEWKLEL